MNLPADPWAIPDDWPAPGAAARAVSERLARVIGEAIDAAGGVLPFPDYMRLALHAPGLGYYSAGSRKFGAAGDFVTAPEISPLFGQSVAQTAAAVLTAGGGDTLLELGPGSGRLAVDVMQELARQDVLPGRYLLLEPSADLRERQQALCSERIPQWLDRLEWLDRLPDVPVRGLILANEVADALPVEVFVVEQAGVGRLGVRRAGEGFAWARVEPDTELDRAVARIRASQALPEGYRSEVCLELRGWIGALADVLAAGALLLIDYGHPRAGYYHPQRDAGTLMCHYRHRAHADPFLLPGLQDITAQVDFTAVAEAADAAGLKVAGFATQAFYLLDTGLEQRLALAMELPDTKRLKVMQAAKTLTLPGEMGERFKCMLLTRGIEGAVAGFRRQDLRDRL